MNQERCEPALRRDTDVKWIKSGVNLLSVEIPTLNESVGIAQGSATAVESISHCQVRRRYGQGESISPSLGLSTFFYVCCCHYPPSGAQVQEIGVFEYTPAPPPLTDVTSLSSGGHITLTIYRHNHRWPEIGDITSDGLWFNTLLRLSFSSLSSRRGCAIRISILISYSTLICGYCCVLLCIHPPSIFTYGPFWRRGCRPLFIRVAYRLRYQ
jgi:hypothetical protein